MANSSRTSRTGWFGASEIHLNFRKPVDEKGKQDEYRGHKVSSVHTLPPFIVRDERFGDMRLTSSQVIIVLLFAPALPVLEEL